VAQLGAALRYKLEGRGVRFPGISLESFTIALGLTQPLIDEYQEYFLGGKGVRCLGLTNLPPSCTECLQICEPLPPGTLRASPDL